MTAKQPDFADLNALAIEACDLWQDHLSTFARDPSARAELTRFLEPQRRLFADWAALMQQGAARAAAYGAQQQGGSHESQATESGPAGNADAGYDYGQHGEARAHAAAAPGGDAHGDDSLRLAQLALRVAELEKRLAQLEQQLVGAARRTQRTAS